MFGALAAVAAKLTSAGVTAQAATGLSIALASVTGAGALGVLPAPVQDRVSGVVEAATPFDLPDSADASSPAEKPTVTVEEAGTVTVGEAGEPAADRGASQPETPEQAEFGQWVSGEAPGDGLRGEDVSAEARAAHQPDTPAAPPVRPAPAPAAPQQPKTARPDTVPAPAPGAPAADRLPEQAGRP